MKSKRATLVVLWAGLLLCLACLGMAFYWNVTRHDRWQTLAWLVLLLGILSCCTQVLRRHNRLTQKSKDDAA